jgi:mannose-6-phosphate isomerase-like protein (cupin superfamily)
MRGTAGRAGEIVGMPDARCKTQVNDPCEQVFYFVEGWM